MPTRAISGSPSKRLVRTLRHRTGSSGTRTTLTSAQPLRQDGALGLRIDACAKLPWSVFGRSTGAAPGEGASMPLFMDVHNIEGGASARDVAEAHQKDLEAQGRHDVDYKRYWVDEKVGRIFCLVEAPDAEAAHTVHREAHGLVADEIYELSEGS
jgi:hypothetical protein